MSAAQPETFSPRNLVVLGGLLAIALFLGEIVVGTQHDDEVIAEVSDTMEDIAMRLKPVVTLDDIRNPTTAQGDSGADTMVASAADELNSNVRSVTKTMDEASSSMQFISETIQNIGGVDNLKDWLKKRRIAFGIQALNYGLPTPRGLLLIGIQGTGKSLTSKAIATEWQLPLLKLDVGKLFGGLVGESESRLRQMIQVAETLSPCILWIDEIDKAFNNLDSKGDSGTSNRMLGTFISWLSEKTKPVFVVATANNVELLPLEIIRKGRFDEIFFLELPKKKEREEIFKIHIKTLILHSV